MTSQEWQRLRSFYLASKIASKHKPSLQGRRAAKGRAKHYGVVLQNSRIHSMSLETQVTQRGQK